MPAICYIEFQHTKEQKHEFVQDSHILRKMINPLKCAMSGDENAFSSSMHFIESEVTHVGNNS